MNLINMLKLAVAKRAADKIGDIVKNIPMQGASVKLDGPKAAKPASAPKAPSVPKPKINTPSTYAGGIDLMAPPISAGGKTQSPGAAWSNNLAG